MRIYLSLVCICAMNHNQKNAVMSRYKKLFDYLETELNAIALDSNLMEIEDIVKEMMVEDKPEPLDPHTCELCVGDVVRINQTKDYGKHVVFSINNHSYSIISARTNKVRLLQRYQLFLESNQRAGVQIGESW